MEIRDVYGLLIDRMQGVPGTVRSGGDGGAARLAAPPPTEKLVAFYSGIVKVGPDGKATGHLRHSRLQRHRPRHGDGLVEGRASAMPPRT